MMLNIIRRIIHKMPGAVTHSRQQVLAGHCHPQRYFSCPVEKKTLFLITRYTTIRYISFFYIYSPEN